MREWSRKVLKTMKDAADFDSVQNMFDTRMANLSIKDDDNEATDIPHDSPWDTPTHHEHPEWYIPRRTRRKARALARTRLQSWSDDDVPTPAPYAPWKPPTPVPGLCVVQMPPDGNCLFHCFATIINDKFPDMNVNVATLRWIVSRRIKKDEYETSKALYEAITSEDGEGAELVGELRYMHGVRSFADFRLAFLANTTWGNEQCVMHLRDFSGIQPLIFRTGPRGTFSLSGGYKDDQGEVFEPEEDRSYAVFQLCGQHYNLMSFNGQNVLSHQQMRDLTHQWEQLK